MIKGKTKSGYKYAIDERKLDEWGVLKAIADMTSGDDRRMIRGTVNFVETVIGEDEKNLVEFVKSKNEGYCPQEAMQEIVNEIIESVKEVKNSQSSQGS